MGSQHDVKSVLYFIGTLGAHRDVFRQKKVEVSYLCSGVAGTEVAMLTALERRNLKFMLIMLWLCDRL